jgi:hypothetical protein
MSDQASILDQFFTDHPHMKPLGGCSIGRGWMPPVRRALEELVTLSQETGVAIKIVQIKEKFGGLRLYVRVDDPSEADDAPPDLEGIDPVQAVIPVPTSSPGVRQGLGPGAGLGSVRDRVNAITGAAEKGTATLCEICGAPGEMRNLAMYHCTRCQACADSQGRSWE